MCFAKRCILWFLFRKVKKKLVGDKKNRIYLLHGRSVSESAQRISVNFGTVLLQ